MSNFAVYKKTFIFSWIRLLIDLLALVVLAACTALGFAVGGGSMLGLGGGFLIGIILFGLMVHYLTYLFKAGQIAMMMRGVTEGTLPDNIVGAAKDEVNKRFVTVSVYFAVTSAISAIFGQISHGINAIGRAAGGENGNAVGETISGVISVLVAYLCDCCLGWIFYKREENAFKATCEGAVLFFKNWKTLLKNMGRIFGFGLASLVLIGGAFTAAFYGILSLIPGLAKAIDDSIQSGSITGDIKDPQQIILIAALICGILLWLILHSVFVRPFVLVGVLRNYMKAGIENPPKEESFAELDRISGKFQKVHQKAMA